MNTTLLGTILIVEDSPSEMELMSHYLREGGFLVLNATGAKQALAVALEQKPNVILTDIVMPGMSGFELCRSLKKNPITQKIPIIICTSKNQEIDRLWGMKQGADAYITKPFSREQLIQSVKSISR
ncbi:MAG: response regulator [Cyanobacteria bacterium P01_F01_bin.150]